MAFPHVLASEDQGGIWCLIGMVIRVDGSCSYHVNIQIVLIFVNINSTRIINV